MSQTPTPDHAPKPAWERLGLRLSYALPEAALAPGVVPTELHYDAETDDYLTRIERERPGVGRTLLQRSLRGMLSDFDANALLGMYPMFLLSSAQLQNLLQLTAEERLPAALDVGAGSGDVTRVLSQVCSRVVTTERSWGMARRLRTLGFECHRVDLAETTSPLGEQRFELICGFNVLDRCPAPRSLVRAMTKLLAPNGRVLLSIPLPFDPMYYAGSVSREPLEALAISGKDWPNAARDLTQRVLPSLGLAPRAVSRVPYLSGGDSRNACYVLDAAVVVCEVGGAR